MFKVKLKSFILRLVGEKNKPQMLQPPTIHGAPSSKEEGAMQLVERSRQGDQNAVAMIAEIGNEARAGNKDAQHSYKLIESYILSNPQQPKSDFGAEIAQERKADRMARRVVSAFGQDYAAAAKEGLPVLALESMPKAIVTAANGPSLLPQTDGDNLLHDVRETFSEGEQRAFMAGVKQGLSELDSVPEEFQQAYLVGHILGTARKIQAVRLPGVPLGIMSPRLGAEFGEN